MTWRELLRVFSTQTEFNSAYVVKQNALFPPIKNSGENLGVGRE